MSSTTALRATSLQVTQATIAAYAELSDDFNPIHVDAAFAARTPMGQPIAHGTLSVCLLWQCLGNSLDAEALQTMALDIRFVKPVYIGDLITAGGAPVDGVPGDWNVWVRGQDGADRIVGVLTTAQP